MYRGLYTQQFETSDLQAAKAWYSRVFGTAPYFDQSYYVGFNINGYEFGLLPTADKTLGTGGGGVYWGVDDVEQELQRLLEAGAAPALPVQEVGHGIKKAAVRDPFGNIFGIIQNPHFGGSH
jgi:predicted enzyme related to lactoylglutathione lyase